MGLGQGLVPQARHLGGAKASCDAVSSLITERNFGVTRDFASVSRTSSALQWFPSVTRVHVHAATAGGISTSMRGQVQERKVRNVRHRERITKVEETGNGT